MFSGLGVPFNIASYSLLLLLIAKVTGLCYPPNLIHQLALHLQPYLRRKAGDFIHCMGDAHVYSNHVEALKTQITRSPKPFPKVSMLRSFDFCD
jgi:thymidylate synthase